MGAVNLDNTGSGAAVTLSSNGTALLLNGSAIGGGGGGASAITISNKTAAYTVVAGDLGTIINCTANSFTVSLTAAATLGAGFNCWIKNYGSGVITIDPNASEDIDDYFSIVLRPGESVQIFCTGTAFRTNDGQYQQGMSVNRQPGAGRPIASATNGAAIGSNSAGNASQAVTGAGAMALGGSYASGADSFAAAVANHTSTYGAQGANSIAIGFRATATGTRATAIGGGTSIASNSNSTAIGGTSLTASGAFSVALGGEVSTASGESSYAFGVRAIAAEVGKIAWGAFSSSTQGSSQAGMIVLRADTTDATASALRSNANAAGVANQLTLRNNSAYAFSGIIVSRRQAAGGTESAAWKVEGLIRREGTAASTTLVASTVTAISNVPGWTLALSADTTNGGLAVTFTGAAATNIRTVATIQTSEVTYA